MKKLNDELKNNKKEIDTAQDAQEMTEEKHPCGKNCSAGWRS